MKGNRTSCYSCEYSKVQCVDNEKIVICNKSFKIYRLKKGEHVPKWCELGKKETSRPKLARRCKNCGKIFAAKHVVDDEQYCERCRNGK